MCSLGDKVGAQFYQPSLIDCHFSKFDIDNEYFCIIIRFPNK